MQTMLIVIGVGLYICFYLVFKGLIQIYDKLDETNELLRKISKN